nr:uncharacterized protein LOC117278630 [Nicotiana tomentosiformis]
MTGIPLEAAIHKLSLDPNFPPVRQKKRSIAEVENRRSFESSPRNIRHFEKIQHEAQCVFRVGSGKFMRFLVVQTGTKVNPDKIKAIEDITNQLTSVKEVQKLTDRLAALSRFISRSSEKCRHFFSLLKRKNDFVWAPECQQELEDLKRPDVSGRLVKWAVKVSEFDINYKSRTAIKSQILADFVADFSPGLMPLAAKEAVLVSVTVSGVWTLFTDGDSNVKGSGLGILLIIHSGETLRQDIRTMPLTNNEVKHGALVAGLELARLLGSEVIKIKRVFQGPLARCLGTSETDGVMREVHEEVCGNHTGADSWVLTFIRAGYYWPQMEQEAKTFVQKCDKCQRHAQLVHPPAERLHLIKQITSSPYHPSANEKEESTNKIIIQNLKKKLEDAKGNWQMSYRVCCGHIEKMMKSATGETFFSLMYGAEALILMDIRESTIRYSQANEEVNNETLLIKLDLLEEHQNLAYMRVVAQKQRMERYYERRENLQYFKIRDLVLRKVTQISREVNTGKLGPMWEGPYWISAITGKGSYQLGNQNVVKLPSNWNVTQKVILLKILADSESF